MKELELTDSEDEKVEDVCRPAPNPTSCHQDIQHTDILNSPEPSTHHQLPETSTETEIFNIDAEDEDENVFNTGLEEWSHYLRKPNDFKVLSIWYEDSDDEDDDLNSRNN